MAAPPRWRRSKLDRFAAVIFDMDGVLVDGEPLHFEAVNELLARDGLTLTLEQYQPYMGTKSGWTELIRDFGLPRPREHYAPLYHELIMRQYRERSTALPGALAVVCSLRKASMPLALASSSIQPWVEACLANIGLATAFDVIVTGSDVERGKPAPDIYLAAAERLGAAPARCLAIEDAPAGVASAKAAGMTCWAILTPYTRGLALPGADRVFESLTDIDLAALAGVTA
ncbi:MAG: HAD family phosphatase [Chloroflexi bacterium]|nr:HAD family phosphatase [Chloroflexota bacterium]